MILGRFVRYRIYMFALFVFLFSFFWRERMEFLFFVLHPISSLQPQKSAPELVLILWGKRAYHGQKLLPQIVVLVQTAIILVLLISFPVELYQRFSLSPYISVTTYRSFFVALLDRTLICLRISDFNKRPKSGHELTLILGASWSLCS